MMINNKGEWIELKYPAELHEHYEKVKSKIKWNNSPEFHTLTTKATEEGLSLDLIIPFYSFLTEIVDEQMTIEIRGIHREYNRTTACYTNRSNLITICIDAITLNIKMGFNIYISQGYLSYRKYPPSRFQQRESYAKAGDYWARYLIAIDIDPYRSEESPKKTYATEKEKQAAYELAKKVQTVLFENQISNAIADSGNGYYVLINILGLECPESSVKELIGTLQQVVSSTGARIDPTTAGVGCIVRAFGTRNWSYPYESVFRLSLAVLPEKVDSIQIFPHPLLLQKTHPRPHKKASQNTTHTQSDAESNPEHQAWLQRLCANIDLNLIYGDLLTGKRTRNGDLLCRDPFNTGGSLPLAVVSTGGKYDRGRFYSFGTQEAMSLVYFFQRYNNISHYREACERLAELSQVKA